MKTLIHILAILLILTLSARAEENYEPAAKMIEAIKTGNISRVEELIDDDYDLDYICNYCGIRLSSSARIDNGTALMQASALGNIKIMKVLLDAGADPNIYEDSREQEDWTPYTALMLTVISDNIAAVKLLVESDADVDTVTAIDENAIIIAVGFNINGVTQTGGNIEIVKYLIDNDADIYSSNSADESLEEIARKYNHNNIIKLLSN